jgi:hypothetical protein
VDGGSDGGERGDETAGLQKRDICVCVFLSLVGSESWMRKKIEILVYCLGSRLVCQSCISILVLLSHIEQVCGVLVSAAFVCWVQNAGGSCPSSIQLHNVGDITCFPQHKYK